MMGAGAQAALTAYNPGKRTLYVYQRIGEGNSNISCSYSFTVSNPGGPIQRANCPVGEQVPQRRLRTVLMGRIWGTGSTLRYS